MVGDNLQSEVLEMKPMMITGMKDDGSLAEEKSVIDNGLPHESLVADREQQRQLSPIQPWYSGCPIPISKRFVIVFFVIITISTGAVVFLRHHGEHRGKQIVLKSHVQRIESPERIGYFDVYIRESTDDRARRYSRRLRYPAAVYSRNRFPLNGPFINFRLKIPIFAHPVSRQTIIYAPNGRIYLFPKLYNTYGQAFSLGELVASGYASFQSDDFGVPIVIDITRMFRSKSLTGPRYPKIDSHLGSFRGGVRTNYRSLFVSNFHRKPVYEEKLSDALRDTYYGSLYNSRNPYYKKPPSKKGKTTRSTRLPSTTTQQTPQRILTQCLPVAPTNIVSTTARSSTRNAAKEQKMQPSPSMTDGRVMLKNTYLVEFKPDVGVTDPFKMICESLMASHGIVESDITQRHIIGSSLFSGISFSIDVNHSTESLEMIKEAAVTYPVYTIRAPTPIKNGMSPNTLDNSSADSINAHGLTGVTRVHSELHNFGKGVRKTGGTLSSFTSFGPTADLWFNPQISGIGGNVYSTISSAATK